MKRLFFGALFFGVGILVGQDTTSILVVGGQNGETPIETLYLQNELWFVANTGSYGKGSSDIYLFNINEGDSITKSITIGGETEDIAIMARAIGSEIFILAMANTFSNSKLEYKIISFNVNTEKTNEISLNTNFLESKILIEIFNDKLSVLEKSFNQDSLFIVFLDSNLNLMEKKAFEMDREKPVFDFDFTVSDSLVMISSFQSDSTSQLVIIHEQGDSLFSVYSDPKLGYFRPQILLIDSNEHYVLGNFVQSDSNSSDIFIEKFDSNGSLIWSSEFVGNNFDSVSSAILNSNNQICFIGYTNSFGEGGDFGFGRYDTEFGDYFDYRTLGSNSYEAGKSLVEYKGGYVFFGYTDGFESALGDLLIYKTNSIGITNSNSYQRLIDKNVSLSVGINNSGETEHSLELFPNPIDQGKTIHLRTRSGLNEVNIVTVSGENIFSEAYNYPQNEVQFNTSNLVSGVYLIMVSSGSDNILGKLVILQ